MGNEFETILHKADLCVVGGGLSGMCCAIAAARNGIKTILIHERPMPGGNASSEVRMWISGSTKFLETGLVEEFRLENCYRNAAMNYSLWDSILFEKVRFQENLTSLFNCTCQTLEMEEGKIKNVTSYQMTTQTYHKVEAKLFADCSGDSVLAPLSGADFRVGREAKEEFGETLGQDKEDSCTMGMSCLIQARETDSPKKFIPPAWAYKYPTEESVPPNRTDHKPGSPFQNYWYLELGGDRNSIKDTEEIRDELLKTALGFWDHIKNTGDHDAENWELDFLGFLPGKRESRRYMGDWILKEQEIVKGVPFEDAIAYNSWGLDDHHPGGFKYYGNPNPGFHLGPEKGYYTIPLRCLYSRNVPNLLFAGRNISCSHVAISSTRVMATCSLLGQAAGTLAFYALDKGLSLRDAAKECIKEIQQNLMDNDSFIPGFTRKISELSQNAALTASKGDPEALRNGIDRAWEGKANSWEGNNGDWAEYDFGKEADIKEVRITFDSDLERAGRELSHLNMNCCYRLIPLRHPTPSTMVEAFHLEADGKVIYSCDNNYQRLVKIPLCVKAKTLRLVIDKTRGEGANKLFAFEAK